MTLSIVLAALWAIAANVTAMLPSRDYHWRAAYCLIAIGIPILGYVTWQNGPWIGLIVLVAGMSVLRWPVIYLGKWMRGRFARRPAPALNRRAANAQPGTARSACPDMSCNGKPGRPS